MIIWVGIGRCIGVDRMGAVGILYLLAQCGKTAHSGSYGSRSSSQLLGIRTCSQEARHVVEKVEATRLKGLSQGKGGDKMKRGWREMDKTGHVMDSSST